MVDLLIIVVGILFLTWRERIRGFKFIVCFEYIVLYITSMQIKYLGHETKAVVLTW
jgi:hypothetical protein